MSKTFTVTKDVFDDILYPVIACAKHDEGSYVGNMGRHANDRVCLILEDKSRPGKTPQEGQPCAQCGLRPNAIPPGEKPPAPMFELTDLTAEFTVSDEDAKYMLEKFDQGLKGFQGRATRPIMPLIEILEAEEVVAAPPKETDIGKAKKR